MMHVSRLSLLLPVLGAVACSNAGKDITVPGYYTGSFNVHFYIDADGDGIRSTGDPAIPGIRVTAFTATGRDTIQSLLSNAEGRVQFANLPLGGYTFRIDPTTIGDSIEYSYADTSGVRLLARLDSLTDLREVLFSYPTLTTAQARAAAPGKRVVLRGKLAAPPQNFRTADAFVADTGGALRITGATTPAAQAALAIGDSVMVLGTTGTELGQPVLRNGIVRFLGAKSAPLPRVTTVTEARTAGGGTLDAALVQVSGVRIGDTTMVNPDYHVTLVNANDPDDKVVVVVDQLIEVVHANFSANRSVVVRGVLVPRGDGTWIIRPRSLADITFP